MLHPQVAFRNCCDCQKYVYDERTGERAAHRGQPVARPPGTRPPCGYGEKACPKGSPTAGREFTDANWQTYMHYLQCKATGTFPDDPIVARNAGVIRLIEDGLERGRSEAVRQCLLAGIGGRRQGAN